MKEKIINYIETLEAKSLQVDDYFKQRNELYISNQEKDKEIERLNNIINGIEQYIKYYVMNNYKFDNNTADIILYQLEKLKDSDKE